MAEVPMMSRFLLAMLQLRKFQLPFLQCLPLAKELFFFLCLQLLSCVVSLSAALRKSYSQKRVCVCVCVYVCIREVMKTVLFHPKDKRK